MAELVDYKKFIEINPDIRFGKPVIIGTRISVFDVLGWLASGLTYQQILEDFPQLTENSIYACLSFAVSNREKS